MTDDTTTIEMLVEFIQRQHGNKYSRELIIELYQSVEKIVDIARIALTCPLCIQKLNEKYGNTRI